MLVNHIEIREFRGIYRTEKPIELKQFNVVIGKNNSGKTSLLEALWLLPDPTQVYFELPKIKMLHELSSGPASHVYLYTGEAEITCKIHDSRLTLILPEDGPLRAYLDDEAVLFSEVIRRLREKIGVSMDGPSGSFYVPISDVFFKKLKEACYKEWKAIVKRGAHVTAVSSVINKCIDENFTEILVSDGDLCLRRELSKRPVYISVMDLGDGIKRAALCMLWIEAFSPRLILWDNFEASCHPTLAKRVIEWLCEKDSQVVLVTHSIDVISHVVEAKPKDAQVLILIKSPDDVLRAKALSLEEVKKLMDVALDPRQLIDKYQRTVHQK